MTIDIRRTFTIKDNFRKLIERHYYETLVLEILNNSKDIFKDYQFTHIENQAHGECDYIDQFGNKYDVKLLLDEKQGALIGEEKNELSKWAKKMYEESEECEYAFSSKEIEIENTLLYSILCQRLRTVKSDENAIIFSPFPLCNDFPNIIVSHFAVDYLKAVVDKLEEKNMYKCRSVYFIYLGMDSTSFVLREPLAYKKEFISSNCFLPYFETEVSLLEE